MNLRRAGKLLLAMVHAGAMPGTPTARHTPRELLLAAQREAELLLGAGFDGLLLENMHDRPYCRGRVGPEVVATLTTIAAALRAMTDGPLGLQVLAGANDAALAIAHATGLDFIRAEGFVFAHVGDEGLHEACAPELLRYRRTIGADRVAILADIKKKHSSHAITADVSLADTAEAAEFFLADGVVITGSATGRPANPAELAAVRAATHLPIAIGSGITPANMADYWRDADIFIVGSWYKEGGRWDNAVDPARARAIVEAAKLLRG